MSKPGVLILNLGSPDSPSVPDVRRYLREFLMDGRVIDVAYPLRWMIVNIGILPRRPKQSAEAYHTIWTPEGSPLVLSGHRTVAELRRRLPVPVELAMRYQNPSIDAALQRLRDAGVTEILLIPLFPHYAMSSYETAVERVKELLARQNRGAGTPMALHVQPPYFEDPDYIRALAASAGDFLARPYDHLLFSFHGIPERQLHKSDPTGSHCLKKENCCEGSSPAHATCYRAQCFRTVRAFIAATGAKPHSVSFQSRLGRDPWLTPYTDRELDRLAREGVKRILVICPAFIADCLETLEEIGMRGRETFLEAGGKEFTMVPCLNEHPLWLDCLEKMIRRQFRDLPVPRATR